MLEATPIVAASFNTKSSTKVTIPVAAMVIADVLEAEPIVPASGTTIPALNVAAPAALISKVNAEIGEPPSLPWNIISLSLTNDLIVRLSLSILT